METQFSLIFTQMDPLLDLQARSTLFHGNVCDGSPVVLYSFREYYCTVPQHSSMVKIAGIKIVHARAKNDELDILFLWKCYTDEASFFGSLFSRANRSSAIYKKGLQ